MTHCSVTLPERLVMMRSCATLLGLLLSGGLAQRYFDVSYVHGSARCFWPLLPRHFVPTYSKFSGARLSTIVALPGLLAKRRRVGLCDEALTRAQAEEGFAPKKASATHVEMTAVPI
ncbi:hypothetical protein C8Q80DRAFT_581701 [Daedaleopsis nitida]|nr:hypothetical protein C8Q80DRAFT_581701 [Daedaleopsis nitida]